MFGKEVWWGLILYAVQVGSSAVVKASYIMVCGQNARGLLLKLEHECLCLLSTSLAAQGLLFLIDNADRDAIIRQTSSQRERRLQNCFIQAFVPRLQLSSSFCTRLPPPTSPIWYYLTLITWINAWREKWSSDLDRQAFIKMSPAALHMCRALCICSVHELLETVLARWKNTTRV